MKHLFSLVFATAFSTQPLLADTCAHKDRILGLADHILANRTDVPGFGSANFGTDAAYLKIKYDAMTPAQTINLLQDIRATGRRAPRNLDQLEDAYILATAPHFSHLMNPNTPERDLTRQLMPSVSRALILADGGKRYFEIINMARASEDQQVRFTGSEYSVMSTVVALADQSDEFRRNLAKAAEDKGFLLFATGLLLEQDDLSYLRDFLIRHKDNADFRNFGPLKMAMSSTFGLLSRKRNVQSLDDLGHGYEILNRDYIPSMESVVQEPATNWTAIYLNQTGKVRGVTLASLSFLNDFDAGRIDPIKDRNAYWTFMYRAIQAVDGHAEVHQSLSGFDWPSSTHAHFAGRAVESLDWVLAVETFGPYLRGETDAAPDQPVTFGNSYSWTTWSSVAKAVRNNTWQKDKSLDPQMLADLLWENDEFDAAIQMAKQRLPLKKRLQVAKDFMRRLDHQCQQATHFPGQSIRLGGQTVYRFD